MQTDEIVYDFLPNFDTNNEKEERSEGMTDWNQQASPNNNLSSKTIRTSKFVGKQNEPEFSEELSDGGERNEAINRQARNQINSRNDG